MPVAYLIKSESHERASVIDETSGKTVALLSRNSTGDYELTRVDGSQGDKSVLLFSRRVDGEMRPFSLLVSEGGIQVLKIRERIFSHGGKLYIISNVPESKSRESYLAGPKYISRVDNLGSVDIMITRAERRLRGTHVGEISGIGSRGHRVKIEAPELHDVALPLAVASYIINTTHDGVRPQNNLLREGAEA